MVGHADAGGHLFDFAQVIAFVCKYQGQYVYYHNIIPAGSLIFFLSINMVCHPGGHHKDYSPGSLSLSEVVATKIFQLKHRRMNGIYSQIFRVTIWNCNLIPLD